jgi:DnaK suppressor protein
MIHRDERIRQPKRQGEHGPTEKGIRQERPRGKFRDLGQKEGNTMTRLQFLRQIEQRLLNRREALRAALTGDQTLLYSLTDDGVGDEIDAAVVSEQAELRSQLAQVETRELWQIDRALEKLRAGHYGRCETCEKAIPPLRLKYLPYASDCIVCARREERRGPMTSGYRPVNRIAGLTAGDEEATAEVAELEFG